MSSLYEQLAELTPEQRILFEKRLAEKGIHTGRSEDTIQPRAEGEALPLSFAQQRLWFVQQLEPESAAYNAGSALRLRGQLDTDALHSTLQQIVARHESLRTCFVRNTEGKPEQRIEDQAEVKLPQIDLSLSTHAQQVMRQAVTELMQQPFDLTKPPLRFALYRIAEDDHLLAIVTHHIISDRWSVMVFLRELTSLYQGIISGETIKLPALAIQYADWSLWQQQRLKGERLDELLQYWTTRLAAPLPYVELPTDHALPAVASSSGASHDIKYDKQLSDALKSLASSNKVTLFTLLLTAFKTLLMRYSGNTDIIVGSELANRDRAEAVGLIGLLVNTMVMRSDLSGDPTFKELIPRINDTVLGALKHQDLPFEKLVEVLNPNRQLDQLTPLFQAKFDLQQVPLRSIQFESLTMERYPIEEQQTKYQLRFNLQENEDGIDGRIEYSTDLFEADTIVRIASHFETLLRAIVADPSQKLSQLPIIAVDEQRFLLETCNANQQQRPGGTIHGLFEQQATKTPDAIAVIDSNKQLSYRELDQAANRVAAKLQSKGIKRETIPETIIGVCMPRSVNMVIALLGILKAGAAYVPLDQDYPARRLAHIVDNARMDLLICDGSLPAFDSERDFETLSIEQLTATTNIEWQPAELDSKQLAYVIYTSGSTGMPKGVAIEHRNTVAMLHWARGQFDDASLAGVLASTSVCFDLSVFEIFVPLAWGGKLIITDNLLAVSRHPARDKVTLVNTVPSLLQQLLTSNSLPSTVNTVNLAGEALPAVLVRSLQSLSHVTHIYNLYGPSEDTTYSTCAALDIEHFDANAERVSIGETIENTQALILDAEGQPVPIGISGELYLGGDGVARGYLYHDKLSAEKFVVKPLTAEPLAAKPLANSNFNLVDRFYRTGDRVLRRADGQLEFLGRFDHQFKIRGYRIEAGEIELALREHPNIREALVVAHEQNLGEQSLLAYIVGDNEELPETSLLRAWLVERLPSPMVPTLWHLMDALPRLPNGKVDHRALPQPDAIPRTTVYVAPSTATEQILSEIWADLLVRDRVGIDDDFFALGGHSLLAIELITHIEQEFGRSIPLRSLFQAPTVAALSASIDTEMEDDKLAPVTRPAIEPDTANALQPFPLTDIQQAYWLGRNGVFELGNVSTHGYREIDANGLDPKIVENAVQKLIRRHGMLRAVINEDGQQRVLEQVEDYCIAVTNLASLKDSEQQQQLLVIRERLSHQVFELDQWPLFCIEAVRLDADKVRYFVSFDVIIGDAWSLQLMGREIIQLMAGLQLEPVQLSFRDYVLAEHQYENSEAWQRSHTYWQQKLKTLPPAPQLPLACSPSEIKSPRFKRRSLVLNKQRWQAFSEHTRKAGLSASAVILTAFSEVLATWSQHRRFTLNLTLFNRHPGHPDVNKLIGDFTSSMLLGFEGVDELTFADRARMVQTDLWDALEHRSVSGVRVLRDLAKQQARTGGALMPVVFTSTLGQSMTNKRPPQWQAEVNYAVSQTSQVYLDHQVSDVDGELRINWDAIEDLFPLGVLDDMFAAYHALLERLADDAQSWNVPARLYKSDYLVTLNNHRLNNRWRAKSVEKSQLLHEAFFERALAQANATAIITTDREITYQELAQRSLALSQQLQQIGCTHNKLIAISLDKGWQQVVATLAVLASGNAYVPIDPTLPRTRRDELIEDAEASIVISSQTGWGEKVRQISVSNEVDSDTIISMPARSVSSTDLAYVIYTSGSTGMPKGVMIDHRGAVNTLLDINRRIELSAEDRVFALSSLSFDLSVYDLFGTLAAGAALVIPDSALKQDPAHWLQMLQEHPVSIWNSVPALLQLLLDEIESARTEPATDISLRYALLSGDWIPLSLPDQLKQQVPQAQLVSMGGATEASIWSIWHQVDAVDPSWKSIPYGRPLDNQSWYILDQQLNPCPPWTTGQLYIGGSGVACGYWKRPTLTANSFIPNSLASTENDNCHDPVLYRTGDLGRYHPEGFIEFLGREDYQVKVNGHRIELGEIEHALQQHPALDSVVVTTHGTPQELIAYIVPSSGDASDSKLERLAFKSEQQTVADATFDATLDDGEPNIALPHADQAWTFRRQTHRRFTEQPLSLERFAKLLAHLSARSVVDSPNPKYRYPSAGSLYPVEVYLSIRAEQVDGLDSGWYRYHASSHHLQKLEITADSASFFQVNRKIYDQSAFALYLIGNLAAIAPAYGDKRARDFCLLEAGYMSQLLMEAAADFDIGLCPMNDPGFDELGSVLPLDDSRIVLHGMVGGAIENEWSERWMAVDNGNAHSFIDQLQDHLRDRLPEYMVPSRFQLIDELPLSANGKLNRDLLPEPDAVDAARYRAPTTNTEQRIVELWQKLLGVERVGLDDHFFQLGGNSLLAIQLLSGLRALGKPELSIGELFNALTPAAQAAIVGDVIDEVMMPSSASNKTTAKISPINRVAAKHETSHQASGKAFGMASGKTSDLSDETVDKMLAQILELPTNKPCDDSDK